MSAICGCAVEAVETETPGPPCDLSLDPAADAIVTDAERLRQALINLLANARQALAGSAVAAATGHASPTAWPERGVIRLASAFGQGGRVTISVRDRGPGIEADRLSRIFDPYFTTKRTGTGIGLAITRNIVEGLGGVIHVRSRVGEGTEVTIELPRTSPGVVAE